MSRKKEFELPGEHPTDAVNGKRLPDKGYVISAKISTAGIGGGEVSVYRYNGVRAEVGEERVYMGLENSGRMRVHVSLEEEQDSLPSHYERQPLPGGLSAYVPRTADEPGAGIFTNFGPDEHVEGVGRRVTRVVQEKDLEPGLKTVLRATGMTC